MGTLPLQKNKQTWFVATRVYQPEEKRACYLHEHFKHGGQLITIATPYMVMIVVYMHVGLCGYCPGYLTIDILTRP